MHDIIRLGCDTYTKILRVQSYINTYWNYGTIKLSTNLFY